MRRPARPITVLSGLALAAGLLLSGCATTSTAPARETTQRNPQVEQARAQAAAAAALTGAARGQADREIDLALAQLDNAQLAAAAASLPVGDPLYNYVGRALLKRGLPLPRPFDRGEQLTLSDAIPPAERDGYRPPLRVAVLLPLTGELATPAAPVRDGFLAGYYAETRRRPEVSFYNTAGGASAAYDRAVAEGHQLVVGPLAREEVDALFGRERLQVPVLALNRGQLRPPSGAVSFSLSPEEEGAAAADYLYERGARRVFAVTGGEEGQRRAVEAMRERLGERGGTVVQVATAALEDFAPVVQQAGAVDGLFLAMRGSRAREVIPRLGMAGLLGKPVAATSQLTSGTGKPDEDRALDGIAFPTEAWQQRSVRGLPTSPEAASMLPTARGPATRLFAFGYDAWLLTAYLEHLTRSADGAVEGATGTLRVDGFGYVLRTPAWSTFRNGIAVPLADR